MSMCIDVLVFISMCLFISETCKIYCFFVNGSEWIVLGLISSACRRFRRNEGRPNGAKITLAIRAAVEGENCPLNNRTEPTDGHEEGGTILPFIKLSILVLVLRA